VNLSFIPWGSVECVATISFYTKLVLVCCVPPVVLVLVLGLPWVILFVRNRLDVSDDPTGRQRRREQRRKLIKLAVFSLSLMYAAVLQTALSFFNCRTVEGQSYLVADFSLHCGLSDVEWSSYLPLAIVALFVYPIGIPALLMGCLWLRRHSLRRPEVLLSFDIIYEYGERFACAALRCAYGLS
jgi:hypothetical protein